MEQLPAELVGKELPEILFDYQKDILRATASTQLVATDNAGLNSAPATLTVKAANCGASIPSAGTITPTPLSPNAGQTATRA